MIDVIKEVSILTTVPEKSIRDLADKAIYSINEAVVEALLAKTEVVELDIEIGILYLQVTEDEIRYKFTPSDKLEESLVTTVTHGQNLLEDTLTSALVKKITNTYKDLF